MSRIRTIKPEFWSSAQIGECSRDARLLFIGLWNFCDDAGRCEVNCKQIRARIFSFDDDINSSNVRGMLDELSSNGLIAFYEIEGVNYFQVTGWGHQRIDKPTVSKIPGMLTEISTNAHRSLHDGSAISRAHAEGGREGMEGRTDRPTDSDSTKLKRDVDGAASLASPLECGSLRDANPESEKKSRGQPVKAGNGKAEAIIGHDDFRGEAEGAELSKGLRALAAEIAAAKCVPESAKGNGSATGPPPLVAIDKAALDAVPDRKPGEIFGARVPVET
jgi:hypothetical protein